MYQWNNIDIVSVLIAIAITAWYAITKHWIANNIIGLSFSIQGVALISVGSYKIGSLLLVRFSVAIGRHSQHRER